MPNNPEIKLNMPFNQFQLMKLKKTFKLMISHNVFINEDLLNEIVEAHREIKQSGEKIIYISLNKYDTQEILNLLIHNPNENINNNRLIDRFTNIINGNHIWI